ncbi:MAG: hypothetical protein QOI47_869 [Actinomycetota bacterium]|nr:hypothetical protein [Actinomycetota bacterium]
MTLKRTAEFPSEVSTDVGVFDRFAGAAAQVASRAPFFAMCIALVAGWLVQGAVTLAITGDWGRLLSPNYQLEINTTTTIITFLMVALLQNSQTRNDLAIQHKLNAIADGLADLMGHTAAADPDALARDIRELRLAVGLEERESTTHNEAETVSPARRDSEVSTPG